jgi:riboflavin synthase
MFTGIVEETGEIVSVVHEQGRAHITVRADKVLAGTASGDSISIDGVCQTVTEIGGGAFSVFAMKESLAKTSLALSFPGRKVNLERALAAGGRFGGHIVQGHVNCTVPVRELRHEGSNLYLTVAVPGEFAPYCVQEGSITLDGMSLTIARMKNNLATVNIIPTTAEQTTLRFKKTGDVMNLETDIIARYVERLLPGSVMRHENAKSSLSAERMRELGF